MKTIKKSDFAQNIHDKFGFSVSESARIVDILFEEITDSLKRGEPVKIANFGSFEINQKKERLGRNPKTGKPAIITARKVPTFRASAEFKKLLKG